MNKACHFLNLSLNLLYSGEQVKLESMSNLYHSWVSKLPVARDGMVYDPCVVQNVGRFQGMAASSIINTVSTMPPPTNFAHFQNPLFIVIFLEGENERELPDPVQEPRSTLYPCCIVDKT